MKNTIKQLTTAICVITLSTFFNQTYAAVPIKALPASSGLQANHNAINIVALAQTALATTSINLGKHSPYRVVKVQLLQNDLKQRYLLAYLVSRNTLSYKTIRINLSANNTIQYPLIMNYKVSDTDFAAQTTPAPQCPNIYQNGRPLFVIGSAVYSNDVKHIDYPNVNVYVDQLIKSAQKNSNIITVTLLGNNATVKNYQDIMMCPTLKYFFNIGHGDGQSLLLSDGSFDADILVKNQKTLDFSNKLVAFDSCLMFHGGHGAFCPSFTSIKPAPLAYTSGSSELLIYGSVEAYTCFWKKVLSGAPADKATLTNCTLNYDPSVTHSNAGIYFIGQSADDENPADTTIITTNQRTITVAPNTDQILKLNPNEFVTQYAMQDSGKKIVCTPESDNKIQLLNNPGLQAAEFNSYADNGTCQFEEISRIARSDNLTRDIYGFYPDDQCYLPSS